LLDDQLVAEGSLFPLGFLDLAYLGDWVIVLGCLLILGRSAIAEGYLIFVELERLFLDESLIMVERVKLFLLRLKIFASELIENVAGVPKAHFGLLLHYYITIR
jgi:hypothetical protein